MVQTAQNIYYPRVDEDGSEPIVPVDPITWYTYKIRVIDSETSNPISGAIVTWSNGANQGTTYSDGCASTTIRSTNNPPSYLTCSISATGYTSVSNVRVYKRSDTSLYDQKELTPKPSTYYYDFIVKDSSDNSNISGATITIYTTADAIIVKGTGTTTSNGTFTYESSESGTIYFKVSKNGYDTSEVMEHISSESVYAASQRRKTVLLTKTPSATYYRVIFVNDNNGSPVANVRVRLYDNFACTTPYSQSYVNSNAQDVGVSEIFGRIQDIIANKLNNVDILKIKTTDVFTSVYGVDVRYFYSEIKSEFGLIDLDLPSDISTISDLITYLQSVLPRFIPQSVYMTNANGLVSLLLGEQTNTPKNIYAKILSIPDTYILGNTSFNAVTPTLSNTSSGCTFTLTTYVPTVDMYYYFKVYDTYSRKPIAGATVTYYYNGDVIAEQETNSDGFSGIICEYNYVYITVSKNGYNDYSITEFEGIDNQSSFYEIKIEPKNSIRVVYGPECTNPGAPAGGIYVSIYYKDTSTGQYINKGTYVTYSNGYIDTLNTNVYTSGNNYQANVINYATDDPSALRKNITSGQTLIELPQESEGSDTDMDMGDFIFEDFNEMSIGSIKEHINTGNQELKTKYTSNKVSYKGGNDYRIKILDPDSINVYDIFANTPIMIQNNNKSIIGSVDVKLKKNLNELRLKTINRYSGYYNPIFKDVLFYDNMKYDDGTGDMVECPFSNTSFDDTYEDNYGKFGIINNMWFHKVNDNKNIEIITTSTPYYPLTGQYALDNRDYNVFETNWDKGHYTKQVDVETSESCWNISSMKDGVCMFGSKYLNVPNNIEICGVTLGNDSEWKGEWNDDWITQPEACPGEIMYKEINNNSVDFYIFLKKRIIRFFQDKLKEEFEKYVADKFSFGTEGLDDDIEEYVKKNILKLYRLEKVRFFVRRTKRGVHNSKIENDYTKYLEYDKTCRTQSEREYFREHNLIAYFKQHGFVEVNNITLSKLNRDDFDRKLVYNLKNGTKEEFGFSFLLKKI